MDEDFGNGGFNFGRRAYQKPGIAGLSENAYNEISEFNVTMLKLET